MLYNMEKKTFDEVFNDVRCHERFPAASTFKIPLAVMAFDDGILKNETKPEFKWNGIKTPIENWNKNQTPTTWIRESAVWVSQEMTAKLGEKKVQKYLESFDYGNQDMTGGLKYSWLTPAPFITEPMQNTLKISGYEQVTFLDKLWRGELKVSAESQKLTQKIMTQDVSPKGYKLTGKTGSGFTDENLDHRLGWYVGHLQKENVQYLVVVNFNDTTKVERGTFGGREAKELAIKLLTEKGLW